MSSAAPLQTAASKPLQTAGASLVLQRKCACGVGASILTGKCEECSKKQMVGLQTKLRVNQPGDAYEQKADHEQVLAKPAHSGISSAPPRIQRYSGPATGQMSIAPTSVDRVLASPGRPLEPAVRQDMEQRFGHDFSRVRVHTDTAASASARAISANAYTSGHNIAFAADRFAPNTQEGRHLLAHELTHVVQQTGGDARSGVSRHTVQREGGFDRTPEPKDLIDAYAIEMMNDEFDNVGARLYLAVLSHPDPAAYLVEMFEAFQDFPSWEDEAASALVSRLKEEQLDKLASSYEGRYALTLMCIAMMTGSVSDFEREQGTRVLFAKMRQYSPNQFAEMAQHRSGKMPTRVFPIRFMRVTGGAYASPLAELQDNGKIRVSYPQNVTYSGEFAKELKTIGEFVGGNGTEINPNEIVIIKDYEHGGSETPLPALALIDYSNQGDRSTLGKIVELSVFAATLGIASGAAAAGEVGAEQATVRFTATAIWGARLAKAAHVLDVAANVIGVAAFVIDENRDWIVKKLGKAGEWLVRISDIANMAVAIYGFVRLAHAGFKLAKDFHAAASSARARAKGLTNAEASIVDEVDDKLAQLSREIDEEAAKKARAAPAKQEPEPKRTPTSRRRKREPQRRMSPRQLRRRSRRPTLISSIQPRRHMASRPKRWRAKSATCAVSWPIPTPSCCPTTRSSTWSL